MSILDHFSIGVSSILVMTFFASVSVGGLYLVRTRIAPQRLRDDHDVAGFTFGVVGAFYGVILAFVIVAVWQRFERANETASAEGIAILNLHHLSNGLSDPLRTDLQRALHSYVETVLNREWKQMSRSEFRLNTGPEERLWDVLLKARAVDGRQQELISKAIDQVEVLSDERRLRYTYASEDLPSVVWIVIYVGCAITIGFGYFFGTRVFRSQAIMCATFAALIGLTIMAIRELATPYQGRIVVTDEPFRFALAAMNAPYPPADGSPTIGFDHPGGSHASGQSAIPDRN
jgi:hypothetical protein